MAVQIKICGLTREADAEMVIENKADYAGLVMFYEKSRRCNSPEQAVRLLNRLIPSKVKTAAVMVSPSADQILAAEAMGFDCIQIHGTLEKEALEAVNIPLFKAFNVADMDTCDKWKACQKFSGYVFDGAVPGSGTTFDWTKINGIVRDEKTFILAGGLNRDNVTEAILQVRPDVVDVSSGVEENGQKSAAKVREFIHIVRNVHE